MHHARLARLWLESDEKTTVSAGLTGDLITQERTIVEYKSVREQ